MQLQPVAEDLMQLQPVAEVLPESTLHRVEIVPGPYARNTYQCLVILPVPSNVPLSFICAL
jgi:hypothetical protein